MSHLSELSASPHTSTLTAYRGLAPDEQLDAVYEASVGLRGLRVVHINTTIKGGGVAGMISQLCPIANELGLPHERLIVELDSKSARFFASMTDMLQGGGPGFPPLELKKAFLDHLSRSAEALTLPEADLYVVHDPSLAPLAEMLTAMRPAVWFSHLDTAAPNSAARDLVLSWLQDYIRIIFTTPGNVFSALSPEKVRVVRLGIDVFSKKNMGASSQEQRQTLINHGFDPNRPLISQISRFGTWKNHSQAIDIYNLCKLEEPGLQLALVGALEASDDADALRIRDEIVAAARGDRNIHVLSDPTIVDHACVDAVQSQSEVVLQRSTREGFGFTVTEAMWKQKPVVGTSATGIKFQISHGINGIIADQAEVAANSVIDLLHSPAAALSIGQAAKESVRQNHLLPAFLADYFGVLREIF
ncbi:glycosyltransferase [Agrobacterium vitis]|uniref:glycosyltransferase n=1 Tax=Agrobacterium vitis TaxID=373 RepID=UPI001571C4A1|nr:glycosyltransferase [Agrobacterium vitis]NSZ17151.1 glycosyltransferase [Agrobacterium vitis]QZO02880.1 glycosyltransferase [Agrobacterium vitis]UJL88005.1 glycosyltransferase [Agrobacterium vitis]